MSGIYEVGALVVLEGAFTVDGQGTDPSTLTLTLYPPEGDPQTQTLTPTEGAWEAHVRPDQPGIWQWRVVGTGAADAIRAGAFYVRRGAEE